MRRRELSVRWPLDGGTVEIGLLIEEPQRAYWRYAPHRNPLVLLPQRLRLAESDPSLARLKRRLRGATFRELQQEHIES